MEGPISSAELALGFVNLFKADSSKSEYSCDDSNLISAPLCAHLSAMDGDEANGFTKADIEKFFADEGLQGLSRFYPLYAGLFRYDSESSQIKIDIAVRHYEGSSFSPECRAVLDQAGLTLEDMEEVQPVISSPIHTGHPIVVVGIPDVHSESPPRAVLMNVVEQMIASGKRVVLFSEMVGGPIVYSTDAMERVWQSPVRQELWKGSMHLLGILETISVSDDVISFHQADALYRASEAAYGIDFAGVKFDDLAEIFQKRKGFKEALADFFHPLVLSAIYGSQITIVNPESRIPLSDSTVEVLSDKRLRLEAEKQSKDDRVTYMRYFRELKEVTSQPDFTDSDLLNPKLVDLAMATYKVVGQREDLWAGNFMSFFSDPELLLNDRQTVFVYFGGASHMHRIRERIAELGVSWVTITSSNEESLPGMKRR